MQPDWLSRFLDLVPVQGRLDMRCFYGAPWATGGGRMPRGELPYHAILSGQAVLETGPSSCRLETGDIVVIANGEAHQLHDGGGEPADPARETQRLNLLIRENSGPGERLDMLCGRFTVAAPFDRWMQLYLPPYLVVRTGAGEESAAGQLGALVELMRGETVSDTLGGRAMLNALSTAMFTLILRRAAESGDAPRGLLALAGNPRLGAALAALFNRPEHPWTLPELADLCGMSRATLARQFQDTLGYSASDLLTDIRMTLAARKLENPTLSTGAVGEDVGYQSEAAFQRAFKLHMGITPSAWRKGMRQPAAPTSAAVEQ